MDEGWATTFEYLIGASNVGQAKADSIFEGFRVSGLIYDPSPLEDLPIITPEDERCVGKESELVLERRVLQQPVHRFRRAECRRSGAGYAVVLENVGGMAAPVDLVASVADGSTQRFHESPVIGQANLARTTVRIPTRKTLSTLTLDHKIWLDADTSNDSWKATGR